MPESSLSITYSDLQKEVARFLGWPRNPSDWTSDQTSDFADILKSGLRRFYYPPGIDSEPSHGWSFLRTTATLTLVDGDGDYTLPSDFSGQLTTHFTLSAGSGERRITEVSEEQLRALRANDSSAEDAPKYYALSIKQQSPTSGTRWEVLFYPTPDTTYTAFYEYEVIPDTLDETNIYPIGGAAHSDTILEAVLSAAEKTLDDSDGIHQQKFMANLVGSVRKDRENTRRQAEFTWEVSNSPSDLNVDYPYLQRVVGGYLDYGYNPSAFDHTQAGLVDEIIRQGLRQFYHPFPVDGKRESHEWSFMRPWTTLETNASVTEGSLSVSSGVITISGGTFPSWSADGEIELDGEVYRVSSYDSPTQITLEDTSVSGSYAEGAWTLARPRYDMPAGFSALDGPIYYRPGSTAAWGPIQIVSEHMIRKARQWGDYHSRPTIAAITPKTFDATTGTRYQISFWPLPDDEYKFHYRYRVNPGLLDATDKYPWGGMPHSQTVIYSCLAAAELYRNKQQGGMHGKFRECLLTSIAFDQQAITPERLGVDYDGSDKPVNTYLSNYHQFDSNRVYHADGDF